MSRIIVVGGGAAGLMAAGSAAHAGAKVLLVEKTKKLGNKLRLTGNRHCNLGHTGPVGSLLEHYVGEARFPRNCLSRFGPDALCEFFAAQGVPIVAEDDGRLFPRSRNAHDVVAALRRYCLDGGVVFRYGSPVHEIMTGGSCPRIQGVRLADKTLEADAVIVCTGGKTYPKTGSTGDGYRLAMSMGHTVVPTYPGLVALECEESHLEQARGIVLEQVRGAILSDGQTLCEARGDLLFTHQGLSGPLAFGLSSRMGPSKAGLVVKLDLFPDMRSEVLERDVLERMQGLGRARFKHLMRRMVPERLVPLVCDKAGIAEDHRLSQLSSAQRKRTCETLKSLCLAVHGTAPENQAMVTVGGVSCTEVDPRSMASRLVPGLYWAGEILDATGADTGGYNLLLAFSSGLVAGQSAAQWVMAHE